LPAILPAFYFQPSFISLRHPDFVRAVSRGIHHDLHSPEWAVDLQPVHWPPIGLINWKEEEMNDEIQLDMEPADTGSSIQCFQWSATVASNDEIQKRFQLKISPIGCGRYGKFYEVLLSPRLRAKSDVAIGN
jgi:hypothetical protein